MFFRWLVFTSNLISQSTWLKVKLKLVTCNAATKATMLCMGSLEP